MGFSNPDLPWRELERRLSGRPPIRHGDNGGPPGSEGVAAGGETPLSRRRKAYEPEPIVRPAEAVPFAELHAHSHFSFLDGASSPEEMAEEAVRLGLQALTLTDHDGFYGIVRFAQAAEAYGLATGFGAELGFRDLDTARSPSVVERVETTSARSGMPDPSATHLLALARDPAGYASLARTISRAHLAGGTKGRPTYSWDTAAEAADGHWLVLTGCRKGPVLKALTAQGISGARTALDELVARFGRENVAVELTYDLDPLADERYAVLAELASEFGLPLVATTGAHFHAPPRRPLATALAAVRARSSLDEIDGWLPASGAVQHLRSGAEMLARFASYPQAVANAARLGAEIAFPLKLIAPNLPPFPVPDGHDEMSFLRSLAYEQARIKYAGKPHEAKAYEILAKELDMIDELGFPGYFLVVWDLAKFCRDNGILAQGRGSAANSAVCYALGITAIDAVFHDLMFERFLAPERGEPPDIDIDIESGRREEVIQYVYRKHGREHAAQVANVISYRPRSAVRDMAKALGYAQGQQDAWSKQIERGYYWDQQTDLDGGTPASEGVAGGGGVPEQVVALAEELQNAPRHLGIHNGGMVMCDRPVIEVCPVEWGRFTGRPGGFDWGYLPLAGEARSSPAQPPSSVVEPVETTRAPLRTVLQWDKDDCAEAGLVKFDLLGLGMLSAIRYCFEFISSVHGVQYDLDSIPKEQPCVYEMLCAADTVGVFQVESRAQIATLPRLRPQNFYELAIEVALIRPGPIQGNSVHPYIRRKQGLEPITYAHPKLEGPLRRTLGIPLFQEQLMQLAVAVADFSPTEADQLRRAMGSKRSRDKVEALKIRLFDGMAANGITGRTAEEIFEKIQAFAHYGFAESHSLSFALLVYASSWLKRHYPAAFCAALLNAQPMGFYSPQSLVQDARRHGIEVRPPSLTDSGAQATLEPIGGFDTAQPPSEHTGGFDTAQPPSEPAGGFDTARSSPAQPPSSVVELVETTQCSCGDSPPQPAVRLGLDGVRTIGTELARRIVAEREVRPFDSMADLSRRVGLTAEQVEALATAGALSCFEPSRRDALWGAAAAATARPGQLAVDVDTPVPQGIPEMDEPEQLIADLWSTGITTTTYPTALIRDRLAAKGILTAAAAKQIADRTRVTVGGVVTHRQRPGTAGGVTFLNLEDETGMLNIIVPESVWVRHRRVARDAGGMLIRGMLERTEDGVVNVLAEYLERLHLGIRNTSRDFR